MECFALKILMATSTLLLLASCAKKEEVSTEEISKFLYFSTGQCNSGMGITTFSAINSSRMVSKVNLSEFPAKATTILDLSQPYQGGVFGPETAVQSLVDNDTSLLMLTENAINPGDRRIFSIPKISSFNTNIFISDALALTSTAAHISRTMTRDADGSILFSKSVAIEKVGTNALRVPMGANPWVNAPAGTCATSTTFISNLAVMPPYNGGSTGKIIFAHQGASAALNRLSIISNEGYSVAGNCLNGYQISSVPHTNAPTVSGSVTFATAGVSPTAMIYIATPDGPTAGKLIVAYSASVATEMNNNTNLNYAIVMWNVNEPSATAASLSSPVVLYREFSDIFGISAMTYDAETSALYVATASQPGTANQTTAGYGYKIEKFTLNVTTPSLSLVRPGNKAFLERTSATKCITSMVIGSK